jgi:hypothetical protein
MAKHDIEHVCGHTVTHNIVGPNKLRQGKIDWLAARDCSDCHASAQQRERERQSEVAAERAADLQLPVLHGSEKQVAWAEKIRVSMLDAFVSCIRQINQHELATADLKTLLPGFVLNPTSETHAAAFFDEMHAADEPSGKLMFTYWSWLTSETSSKTFMGLT